MSAAEIVLGVTGSIGAYKAADLVRRLKERGYAVTCVMTREAAEFLAPLTLQALSERPVYSELFGAEVSGVIHTTLADRAALLLIAPATANLIAKLSLGLADDLLSCVALATTAPILIAPAMNVHMYRHPATEEHLQRLKRRGVRFVGPDTGSLACGYDAMGHLAEVDDIVEAAARIVKPPAAAQSKAARKR